MFDLQLTNEVGCGLKKGTYLFLVGDSSAGKSFLATTIAAQAAINPEFDDYDIIYDDPENGALFDMETLFSKRVADRVKPPADGMSVFVDDFYMSAKKACSDGRKCIYILDSENALTSKEEAGKLNDLIKAVEKAGGNTAKALRNLAGQYSDGKAKKHSQMLRTLVGEVEESGSILVVLGQTRDDLTGYAKDGIVYSGGRALKFYSHIMAAMSVKNRITKTVNGQPRDIGINSKFKIIKNRYSGKRSESLCPIFFSAGYDAIGGMINWLIEEQVFSKAGQSVNTGDELWGKITPGKLVELVDNNDEEYDKMVQLVKSTWDAIYEKCAVTRRNRYE
jgi:energy-coupling factor transporter ATP-binding protein EcfA2